MEGFNGILNIVWVEDLQMMKDKLIDEKELGLEEVGLKVNKSRRSKMLMINLIIILFHLKLDKFGVMN